MTRKESVLQRCHYYVTASSAIKRKVLCVILRKFTDRKAYKRDKNSAKRLYSRNYSALQNKGMKSKFFHFLAIPLAISGKFSVDLSKFTCSETLMRLPHYRLQILKLQQFKRAKIECTRISEIMGKTKRSLILTLLWPFPLLRASFALILPKSVCRKAYKRDKKNNVRTNVYGPIEPFKNNISVCNNVFS